MLNIVHYKLEKDDILVLRYGAEKFETTELLARALLSDAIRALTGPVEKMSALAARQIKRFFGSLEPELTYVLDGIDAMAKDEMKKVAVILDESQ